MYTQNRKNNMNQHPATATVEKGKPVLINCMLGISMETLLLIRRIKLTDKRVQFHFNKIYYYDKWERASKCHKTHTHFLAERKKIIINKRRRRGEFASLSPMTVRRSL